MTATDPMCVCRHGESRHVPGWNHCTDCGCESFAVERAPSAFLCGWCSAKFTSDADYGSHITEKHAPALSPQTPPHTEGE